MCTVTFIPFNDSFFITSNRDESPDRQAVGIKSFHSRESNTIHFPLDEASGGSWIALSDEGRAVCLLNGGFESFIPNPPYRLSRGQVVIAAAKADEIDQFITKFELKDIAPFTLVVFENQSLVQLVWDGQQKHIQSIASDQPHIWSSATLYPLQVREWRKSLFEKWINETEVYNRESIIAFHQMANGDPDNGFIMNRNEIVKTLSVTSIVLKKNSGSILHLDLERADREEIMVHYGE